MLELIYNTGRNIGLGIFVNGAFALQFGENMQEMAVLAVCEGIFIMFLAGYFELKQRRRK